MSSNYASCKLVHCGTFCLSGDRSSRFTTCMLIISKREGGKSASSQRLRRPGEAGRSRWAWQKMLKFRLVSHCTLSLTKCKTHFSMVLSCRWVTCSLAYIVYAISSFERLLEAHSFHCQPGCLICSAGFGGWPTFWMDTAVKRRNGRV